MEIIDCHLCGCKKVCADEVFNYHDNATKVDEEIGKYTVYHRLMKCRECDGVFYEKVANIYESNPRKRVRLALFPAENTENIPDFLDKSIRKPYISALKCMAYDIPDAASTMLRKTVYMICKHEGVNESISGEEKIKALNIPKVVKDVLLNIKGIGDWGGHEDYIYSNDTLRRAQKALEVIIRVLYTDRELLKNFVNETAKEKGAIEKEKTSSKDEE